MSGQGCQVDFIPADCGPTHVWRVVAVVEWRSLQVAVPVGISLRTSLHLVVPAA